MSDKETQKTPHPPAQTPQPIREEKRGTFRDSVPGRGRDSVEKMQRPDPWPPPPEKDE